VVGRQAAALVGPAGCVVAVDVNPAMVTVAARLAPAVDWRVGGDAAVSMRAPFALGDREELRDLLVAAGFAEPFAARFPSAPELLRQEVAAPHWPTSSPGCPPRSRTGWPSSSDAAWTTSTTTTASRPRCRPGWRSHHRSEGDSPGS
jgi:hypothetical protein